MENNFMYMGYTMVKNGWWMSWMTNHIKSARHVNIKQTKQRMV
jgi:hypothetical protein